jgi:beta-xylosidase|tara:strand:- start:100 stop:285 length:186 start_codon:yes stop_codon:yes gene_type:complete
MQLITPKRSTKQLEKGFLYEVVSGVDNFGYFKVREPQQPEYDFHGAVHFIHKSNMRKVDIV